MTAWAWRTTQPGGLRSALARGLDRATSGDWTRGPIAVRTADLRAVVAATALVRTGLAGSWTHTSSGPAAGLELSPAAPEGERASAAHQLARTLGELAPMPATWRSPALVLADEGSAARRSGGGDAAFPWPAVVVAGIAVAGWVAAAAYVVEDAAAVVDRELARREATRRMLAQHADVVRRLDSHADAERAAGRALPFDSATRASLGLLERAQDAAREQSYKAASSGGSWWPIAAVAAGLYFLMEIS